MKPFHILLLNLYTAAYVTNFMIVVILNILDSFILENGW